MTDLAKLVVKLEAETSKYVAELEKANKKLDAFAKSTDLSLAKIGKSFAAVGLAAATGLALLTKNAIDSADHLNDLSKQSGVSVENIQKLGFAFKQGGVDSEGFATILKKLNQSISEGAGDAKSEAALAYKLLGINLKDAAGNAKTADVVLSELADKFAQYSDGPNKTALALKLMGKAGQEAIPTLNDGSKALADLGEQAVKAGLVISSETASAADELNDKVGLLTSSFTKGLGNALAEKLIPSFTKFANVLSEDHGRMDAFNAIAGVAAITIKGLVAAGIVIVSVFQQAGRVIYGLGAALVDVVQGAIKVAQASWKILTGDISGAVESFKSGINEFKEGGGELGDAFKDVAGNINGDFKKIKALFSDESDDLVNEVKVTVKKIKQEAPNLAAAKVANDASLQAIKKLEDLNTKLKEQVATFGQGEVAAIKYRLAVGDLSDEVKAAGAAGKKLADSIIQQTSELEKFKNVDAVAGIDNQILELTGHIKEATIAAFDLQNKALKTSLQESGDKVGLEKLETLKKLMAAQAEFTEQQREAEKVSAELARTEQQIQNSLLVGAETDLSAIEKTSAARAKAVKQLDEIHAKQEEIAEASGNPQLVEGAKKFGDEIDNLRASVDLLGQHAAVVFEDAFGNAFADFITGAKSAGDAVKSFFLDLEREAAQAVAKNFAQQIFGSLGSGGSSTGSGGGWLQTLGSIAGAVFGGGRATGGPVQAGMIYKVNEDTPRSEYFAPAVDGQIVPASGMGGTSIVNHFTIQAPKGSVSRQTERQIAAGVASSIFSANRRNN